MAAIGPTLGADRAALSSGRRPGGAAPSSGGQVLRALLLRLATLAVVLAVLSVLPWGGAMGPMRPKHAVLTLLAVAGVGKALYDTFFYDRFRQ